MLMHFIFAFFLYFYHFLHSLLNLPHRCWIFDIRKLMPRISSNHQRLFQRISLSIWTVWWTVMCCCSALCTDQFFICELQTFHIQVHFIWGKSISHSPYYNFFFLFLFLFPFFCILSCIFFYFALPFGSYIVAGCWYMTQNYHCTQSLNSQSVFSYL